MNCTKTEEMIQRKQNRVGIYCYSSASIPVTNDT